ncbi:hypothetical protein [Luteibacter sp.]|uniref:hypothetical protein n=1 Tax=Luteibacter sp. TaxID=1886636 RepID=UPI0028091924|nr:hypothetical protein [Luteibacter sp.]MDQ8051060.1 hypothetical protein [Luteibacter sp.]
MRTWLFVVLMGLAFSASAQEAKPDPSREAAAALAKDLAALQTKLRRGAGQFQANGVYTDAQYAANYEKLMTEAMEGARAIQVAWKSNPYVEIEGFSVALGFMTAEVSMDFRFK